MMWRFEYSLVLGKKVWYLLHEGIPAKDVLFRVADFHAGKGCRSMDMLHAIMGSSSAVVYLEPYTRVFISRETVRALSLSDGLVDPHYALVRRVMDRQHDCKIWELVNGRTWYHIFGDSGL